MSDTEGTFVPWTPLGTMRINTNGKRIFILDSRLELFFEGKKVEMDKYRTAYLSSSEERIQSRLQRGNLTQTEADEKLKFIADKNIKFDISLPPASNEE